MNRASTQVNYFRGNGPNPKPSNAPPARELRPFFGEFLDILETLAGENFFTKTVGDECSDGHPCHWWTKEIARKIVLFDYDLQWPLEDEDLRYLSDGQIRQYVELFYRLVSAPLEEWFHSYCGSSHPKSYDDGAGQAEYTKRVNRAFLEFAPSLCLIDGRVVAHGSRVLQPLLADALHYGGDEHLQNLVESAVRKYLTGQEQDQMSAVTDLANALERIKSSLDSNKQRSAMQLVQILAPSREVESFFEQQLRGLATLANRLAIRHHELDKIKIAGNSSLIEFLFYSYYNLIRYGLTKLDEHESE